MSTKQTIAIIGATGNMGSGIAKSLSKTNNRLLLFAQHTDKVKSLVEDIKKGNPAAEVEAMECPTNASWEADIILLALPYAAEKEIAAKIKEVANQKIVISISNPLNETYSGLVTSPDTSAAEHLQQLLPNSKVVKAFNTVFAADFANTIIDGKQIDTLIAGNDAQSLDTVSALAKAIGLNPLVAGELPWSRTLENMALLLIQLTMKYNYNWVAGWKVLHN
ncbi:MULTISPECIES: NADPH-dependent F420 reductase [Niastella]|uniref:NAD(P)-binding domain-containing protein n=1 Tax=Niastella soli TaxID=2821487 RepID=A0ABS3YXX3_9BACT|nr:NAD(P)-binding domain-containing protein [Niastella soli]MBO9202362.1 NAD(P)-binding domain-containing protein [Niastella soli]